LRRDLRQSRTLLRQRGRTVQEIIFSVLEGKHFWESRFGYSIRLGIFSLILAIVIGVPAGILAALRQNTLIDYASSFVANIGVSIPNFVIGIYLIIIFAVTLHWINVVPRSWSNVKV